MAMRTIDYKGREASDLRKVFGDLPLIEADGSLLVYISRDEIDNSVRGDPRNCMFANACKRAFGARAVLFYPTVAYVDTLDEDGERVVMRFRVTAKTRQAIEKFDAQPEQSQVEAAFWLRRMPKGKRLKRQNADKRRWSQELREGTRKKDPDKQASSKEAAATRKENALMGLRVGSGNRGLSSS